MKIMKLIIILLFFITNLFSEDKKLKIIISTDMIPYSFVDKNKEPKGIFVDYWKLWAKKTNQKIEFVPLSWNDGINTLKSKKAHIHSGLFKNKQREEFTTYLDKIYPSQVNLYVNSNEKDKIKTLKDINKKTIGVLKGTYFETYIKQNLTQLDIKEFTTFTEQFKAIRNKQINLFMEDSLIAWSQLIDDFSFTEISAISDFKLDKWFYAGIKKDDNVLEKLVKNGMKQISEEEIIDIEKKWIIEDSLRYFENKKNSNMLSFEERYWLLQNPHASLALVKDWDKFSFFDENRKLKGFHIDLINTINKNLNIKLNYKLFNSWASAYNSVKNGETESILGLSRLNEREEFFHYSSFYHFSPLYVVVKDDNKDINSIDDFDNKTIASLESSVISTVINEHASNVKHVYKSGFKDILKSISSGKVDAALFFEKINKKDLKKHGLKIVDNIFSKYGELSIGTNRDKEEFSKILEKGINSITSDQMKQLNDKWFNEKISFSDEEIAYIKNSPTLKVGLGGWTPILDLSDSGNVNGIAGELTKKAFEISGLKIEYVKDNWNVLLQKFKDGEIDILPAAFYNKQRAKYGEFTKKYMSIKNYIFVKNNNTDINSFDDLKFKKLAIQKGYGTINLIKELYPDIQIIETKSLEDSIFRVLNEEVDALFELQLVVKHKMKELLVTNLKSINQNSIKSQGLHIFTKKDDFLLNSILQKSLDYIPIDEKNQIISNYFKVFDFKKDLNVAFGIGTAPYLIHNDGFKGIEYDLIKKILSLSSLNISNSINISSDNLENVLIKDKNIDISVGVEQKDNHLFYSDSFIEFENVVVSRKKDNIKIESVSDLKGNSIISFIDAHKYLGDEFNELFNTKNRPKSYKEVSSQEKQVDYFLNEEVDLIILDKNIFKWFFHKLNDKSIEDYQFHYIFPKNKQYRVAFKDENLRNVFNKNLEKIKETGEFEQVIADYTGGLIKSKVKINTLISSVISNFIFTDEIEQLSKIIEIFSRQAYINKIEVYNTENELLTSTSSSLDLKKFTYHDSYYVMVNVPQKVGFIKVYFDDALLEVYQSNSSFIPRIELFEDLKGYEYIKQVYKKFGYLKKTIDFTKKEKEFIKRKKVITYSIIDWPPLSIVNNDKYYGVFKDYLNVIEQETGLLFKFVPLGEWKDVSKGFTQKKIDLIPGIGEVAFTFKNALVSNIITSFKYAVVTNEDGSYLDGLKDLEGKTVALPKNFSSYHLIKNSYKNINIVETSGVKEALTLVSKNKVDAFVGHSALSVHSIQNSFPDLKIVGLSEERFNHHMLIQDDYAELLSIINKVIFNISPKQKQLIKNRWIHTDVGTIVDYSIIYKVVTAFTIILIIILVFIKKLSKAKKEIELANNKMQNTLDALMITKEELLEKTKDLEEQRDAFETLFNETTDGLSLIKDGKFIACNQSVVNMLKYKSKEEFLNLKPHQLSPEFQPDGKRSDEKALEILNDCMKTGSARFEWVHTKSTGKEFWVEIVLTKIVLNHEDIIHVVWRDIEDKKVLEKQNLKRTIELEETNEELEVSIENLKQTQQQLIESEKMASLGGLVAGVAHEINTPIGIGLTGITHFEEIARNLKSAYENDLMTQEDFEEFLKTSVELSHLINTNLNRAVNLVKSFKQVAVDQTSEERREFYLHSYIDEILASIHSVTKKAKLNIKVKCDNRIKINSYPGAISQILTNLIMNSIIHGFEKDQKGLINIDIEKNDNEIRVIYKDDGKGIPEENLSKIFDPFFTTNRENGGSGLGLNIIYNIVTTKLNGKISCKNNQKGIEFIIVFNV